MAISVDLRLIELLARLTAAMEKIAAEGFVQHVHHYEHEIPPVYKYEPATGVVIKVDD